jgi:hypothetical protein
MDIGIRQGMIRTETPDPRILGVEGVGRGAASEILVRHADKATEGHPSARLGKQD